MAIRGHIPSLEAQQRFAEPADAAAWEQIASLVFDRLVMCDDSGEPQPALALSWSSDAEFKRWQFRLRPGVKFHDGSTLTPTAVATALQTWGAALLGDSLVIQSDRAEPYLPLRLARAGGSIWKRASDGTPIGTGPFRVREWEGGRRAVFAANDEYWGGRPFLDTLEIEMGRTGRDPLRDLEMGKADAVEIGPADARRAAQGGGRVWSSLPLDLLAVVFEPGTPAPLAQALSLSIDRAAIHNVLLQRQGAPAGGLLPDWLSGYASLFAAPRDIPRARQTARTQALTLGYNPVDTLARAIAERIAVDSREAGLLVRPVAQGTAQAHLVRLRMPSVSAGPALAALAATLGSRDVLTPPPSAELQYAVERNLMEEHRVVPVCHLPDSYALAPRVKNWSAARWGAWRIESVWIGAEKP